MVAQFSRNRHAAQTIKNQFWSILNAVILELLNGPAESIYSGIKTVRVRSRGFRNNKRLANTIYFHLGGLDLYPRVVLTQTYSHSAGVEPMV